MIQFGYSSRARARIKSQAGRAKNAEPPAEATKLQSISSSSLSVCKRRRRPLEMGLNETIYFAPRARARAKSNSVAPKREQAAREKPKNHVKRLWRSTRIASRRAKPVLPHKGSRLLDFAESVSCLASLLLANKATATARIDTLRRPHSTLDASASI